MLLKKGFYVFSECSVVVSFIMRRFAVVSCVDGVYGTLEDARKCTGSAVSVKFQPRFSKERSILSNTLVIPLAPEQAMYNHDRISIGLARVIMKPIRKVDDSQIRRHVK
jgi:hypothetical protein